MVGRSYIVGGSIYLTLTTGFCTGLGVMLPAASLVSVVALSTFGTTPALSNLSHSGTAPLPTTTVSLASPVPTPVVSPTVAAMVLSPALDPVPQRLVQRIRAGLFVEMRELLGDNIALHDQLEAVQAHTTLVALPSMCRTRQREVPSLVSWLYCFLTYVAVRTSDPAARDMLAYGRLIAREALRHGGRGWQEYDRTFRRQRELDPTLPWNTLLPDLQATTILGQRKGGGTFCTLCRGSDHTNQLCALASLQQQVPPSGPPLEPSQRYPRRYPSQPGPICTSWNNGACAYPGRCNFRHVCATCSLAHRARDCPDTPDDSPYRRSSRRDRPPAPKRA